MNRLEKGKNHARFSKKFLLFLGGGILSFLAIVGVIFVKKNQVTPMSDFFSRFLQSRFDAYKPESNSDKKGVFSCLGSPPPKNSLKTPAQKEGDTWHYDPNGKGMDSCEWVCKDGFIKNENTESCDRVIAPLEVISPAFLSGDSIPKEYTCLGLDTNPPLEILGAPSDAKYLAIIAKGSHEEVYWVAWNIPISSYLPEGLSATTTVDEGINSRGNIGYNGPCPKTNTRRPKEIITFSVFAESDIIALVPSIEISKIEATLQKNAIGKGVITAISP